MEQACEQDSVDLDFLPPPDVESDSSPLPQDDDNDEGTTEGKDLDDRVLHDDDKDNNSTSASSSQQVENDMASLEGYLDGMLYEEDTSGPHYYGGNVNAEGELDDELPPSYVEGSDVKDFLQSLMDEQIPPRYKSQIEKLHPTEEELIIIMRKNNLPIKLYKVLLDWAHHTMAYPPRGYCVRSPDIPLC
jgi:hypothetical protein